MFIVKKIVPLLLCPVSLCLGILILGLICLWGTRRLRLGKVLVTLGTVLLLLLSLPCVSEQFLTPLERRYPALLHPEKISWEGQKAGTLPSGLWCWGVVTCRPRASRLPVKSMTQPWGVWLKGCGCTTPSREASSWLSGGRVFDPVPEAEVMAQIAGLLGVKPQDISLESDSRDTADQAEIIAKRIGRERFILVTTAFHMPRSMALFRKRGLQPIPAPTNFQVRESQGFDPNRFFPKATPLGQVEIALHEYLGLAWAWLRGEI